MFLKRFRQLLCHCVHWRPNTFNNRKYLFYLFCGRLRLILRWRLVQLFLFLLSATLLVLFLHLKVLPKSMGYYHEDCFLQEGRKEHMRFLLRHVVNFLNEENATYWLDFGTLLGVIREGDIIGYDADMDVSRLADNLTADKEMVSRFTQKMSVLGIEANALIARYQGVQVDMFRWQTANSSGKSLLHKYYPFVPATSLADQISNYLFPAEIPADMLFPLRQISVFGVLANIPHKAIDFLKRRYPLTWYFSRFPYKWKCWVGKN